MSLKDAACAQTKVILDIRQGKQVMASKGYVEEYTKAGTAVVLRLTQPWHGLEVIKVSGLHLQVLQLQWLVKTKGYISLGL